MKKNLLLLTVISLIALTSCRFGSWKGVKGNGDVVTEERDIDDFSRLEVGGAFNVHLKVGEEASLTIETDKNLMKYIGTKVRGNKLSIESKKNLKPSDALEIYITTPEIEDIDCSGAASLYAKNINSNRLKLDVSGAADADIEGEVDILSADVSGAASLEARNLLAQKVNVEASGASSASVSAYDYLSAEASGASSVNYYGTPKNGIKTDVSGASSITAK